MSYPELTPWVLAYRERKLAIEAIARCRQRCWQRKWVLDLDIKGFFGNVDHALLLKASERHASNSGAMFYMKHWLKASVQGLDGIT